MEYFAVGSHDTVLDAAQIAALLDGMLAGLGPLQRVLLVPPDITRLSSGAGAITTLLYERLKDTAYVEVLPALGTHAWMTPEQLGAMFPGIPSERFRVHDWRRDVVRLGQVPADFVRQISEGKLAYPIECEISRYLVEGRWDRIISIGQLVPHEVAGIAGHCKNIFIGLGGADVINKTHFIGAVYGLERLMGRTHSPVRDVLNDMATRLAAHLPITYVLIVRGPDDEQRPAGGAVSTSRPATRGLFAGDDEACYVRGAELCRRVNIELLDRPLRKVVVYLDPVEYHSTWLGNKAIYRTRMAIADGGQLLILAPGVSRFGEDPDIDALIRRFGYRGTPHTLQMVAEHPELAANLAAAAHFIHGSSEGRFEITYCAGGLRRDEIEQVGFRWADPDAMLRRYNPRLMKNGPNVMPDGETVFYVSNPGLGLWTCRKTEC